MKYMTMEQAFKCNDDDIPFIDGKYSEGGFNSGIESGEPLTKSLLMKAASRPSITHALSEKWQVKKADTKVLTATEVVRQYQKTQITNFSEHGFSLKQAIELVKYAEQNGKLIEWNRTSDLRKFVEDLKNCDTEDVLLYLPRLFKAFDALKHPHQ